MASSGYTAWSVTFGEQPTATKWNLLGSNDSAFNLGTGLEDAVIINRHIAANAITAGQLATGAVLLGKSLAAADQTGITTVETDITFATVTVTVPTGGRDVMLEIGWGTGNASSGSADQFRLYFKEGATYLGTGNFAPGSSFGQTHISKIIVPSVAAGSHTYKVAIKRVNGTGSWNLNYLGSTSEKSVPYFAAYGL